MKKSQRPSVANAGPIRLLPLLTPFDVIRITVAIQAVRRANRQQRFLAYYRRRRTGGAQ